MSTYNHFCFLQHIRFLAFPHINPSAVLPSAERSLRDVLTETCYFSCAEPSYDRDALPTCRLYPRSSVPGISLVGYHSPALIRALRAAMERSLIRTRELCHPMLKVS